jgi:hypothetical protein
MKEEVLTNYRWKRARGVAHCSLDVRRREQGALNAKSAPRLLPFEQRLVSSAQKEVHRGEDDGHVRSSSCGALDYSVEFDPRMYTPSAVKHRKKLSVDCRITQRLKRFFFTFKSVQLSNKSISRREFMRVYMLKAKAIYGHDFPALISRAKVLKMARTEWSRDVAGQSRMTKEQYYKSLWEIVDHWCQTTQVEEYLTFLDVLFERIAERSDGGLRSKRTYTYKHLAGIESGPPLIIALQATARNRWKAQVLPHNARQPWIAHAPEMRLKPFTPQEDEQHASQVTAGLARSRTDSKDWYASVFHSKPVDASGVKVEFARDKSRVHKTDVIEAARPGEVVCVREEAGT